VSTRLRFACLGDQCRVTIRRRAQGWWQNLRQLPMHFTLQDIDSAHRVSMRHKPTSPQAHKPTS
jgi:hypothetical protein